MLVAPDGNGGAKRVEAPVSRCAPARNVSAWLRGVNCRVPAFDDRNPVLVSS